MGLKRLIHSDDAVPLGKNPSNSTDSLLRFNLISQSRGKPSLSSAEKGAVGKVLASDFAAKFSVFIGRRTYALRFYKAYILISLSTEVAKIKWQRDRRLPPVCSNIPHITPSTDSEPICLTRQRTVSHALASWAQFSLGITSPCPASECLAFMKYTYEITTSERCTRM